MLTLRVYQVQRDLLEKYYDDGYARGMYSTWKNLKRYHGHRFVNGFLDMRPYIKVFECDAYVLPELGINVHPFWKEGGFLNKIDVLLSSAFDTYVKLRLLPILNGIYDLFNGREVYLHNKKIEGGCYINKRRLRSITTGDVISIHFGNTERYFYVDRYGLRKIFPMMLENDVDKGIQLYYIKQVLLKHEFVSFIDTVSEGDYLPEWIYAYREDVVKVLEGEGKVTYVNKEDIPEFLLPRVHKLLSMWETDYGKCILVYKALLTKKELEDLERSLPLLPYEAV